MFNPEARKTAEENMRKGSDGPDTPAEEKLHQLQPGDVTVTEDPIMPTLFLGMGRLLG